MMGTNSDRRMMVSDGHSNDGHSNESPSPRSGLQLIMRQTIGLTGHIGPLTLVPGFHHSVAVLPLPFPVAVM